MDLISIVIPYFKKKKYFLRTLQSIFEQTYKYFEIIIIYDDQNKDDLNYIKMIKKKYMKFKIKIIINKKNLGAGLSRNKGIKKSKGKYIAFLDADDVWEKNKLKKQLRFMKKNNYIITHTSYFIVNKNNKILETRNAKDIKSFDNLLVSCNIGLSTVMIKRNVFRNKKLHFISLKTKEDFFLWLMFLKNKINIYSISQPLTFWLKTNDSLSSSTFQKLKDSFSLYNEYLKMNYFFSIYRTFQLSINYLIKKYV